MEFREIDKDIESLFTEYINEWYENEEPVVPWRQMFVNTVDLIRC